MKKLLPLLLIPSFAMASEMPKVANFKVISTCETIARGNDLANNACVSLVEALHKAGYHQGHKAGFKSGKESGYMSGYIKAIEDSKK